MRQRPIPTPAARPRYYFGLLFWYRKNPRQPQAPGVISCRITIDKVPYNFGTGVRVYKHEWDAAGQQVRGESAAAANVLLAELRAGLTATFGKLAQHPRPGWLAPARVLACYREPALLSAPAAPARARAVLPFYGFSPAR